MSKIEEAQEILKSLGLPPAQYNEMAALTFLAICNIKENDNWANATRQSLGVTKGIMTFVNENYGKSYAPNTRETFRRQVLHQFVQARVVDYNRDKPDLPVNRPNSHYALTKEVMEVIMTYETNNSKKALAHYIAAVEKLPEAYQEERE